MRIGIDLGGTKIEGIVMAASGEVLHRLRTPTPAQAGYDAIVAALARMVGELEALAREPCSVGIGTPGTISRRTGMMKNANTTSLNGRPLREDLQARLAREIRIANDANCLVLSEARDGAGAGFDVVFGVILGTGVGGGVVVGGRIHEGPNGIAGEWGHTPLRDDGPECYCGRRGCVETFLSGPGLAADYRRSGGASSYDAHAIARRAASGEDALATAAMDRYCERFGRGLATVIDILDPDAVVLGGGLSNIDRLYVDGPPSVAKHLFSDELRTPILRNMHGDSSGVRGAAMLWST